MVWALSSERAGTAWSSMKQRESIALLWMFLGRNDLLKAQGMTLAMIAAERVKSNTGWSLCML